jgi:hypothetical protein
LIKRTISIPVVEFELWAGYIYHVWAAEFESWCKQLMLKNIVVQEQIRKFLEVV